ncbi:MAG: C69 family dipeptidase [bacterium]
MKRTVELTLRRFILLQSVLLVVLWSIATAQDVMSREEKLESCTSIMVGKLATTDGSVITCHSCDGNYRTWLNVIPHKKYDKGAKRQIWWGNLHTETPNDMARKILKGDIPQVEETYSYLNTAYPCLNEKQLAFGETTIGGRQELENGDGLFLIEELQAIALERCSTARDAIKLMGSLAEQYGYGDSGECLTVADTKEVWHFEIMGAGPTQVGAVWAAVRIPDDHVGVSANIPRISELKLEDSNYYMASKNVHSLAKEMGWWDSEKEPFKFWKAYSGRKPFSTREFFILSTFAPSLNLSLDAEELPFFVKPEKKVSVRDVIKFYRNTYEGTDLDAMKNLLVLKMAPRGQQPKEGEKQEMVKSTAAQPWMNYDLIRLINTLKPGTIEAKRTIAITGCSYSQIIQCRDWLPEEIGAVAWFSFDNPAQSPRIPIFSGALELPKSFEICMQKKFRTDAAGWWFRRANRLAQVRWGQTRDILEKSIMEYEEKGFDDLPMLEKKVQYLLKADNSPEGHKKAREYVTRYTNDFARATMERWWELGDQFWSMFSRGF